MTLFLVASAALLAWGWFVATKLDKLDDVSVADDAEAYLRDL